MTAKNEQGQEQPQKKKQIPCGNDRKKSESNDRGKCRDLSTSLRFGRDDGVWVIPGRLTGNDSIAI
jgi:hypothetical protein